MIEIRFVVNEDSVKVALGLAFAMLDQAGVNPVDVHVRNLDQQ